MRRFIYGSLSTLVIATATVAPSFATPLAQPISMAMDRMEFNFTAPFISSSALLNDHHLIRVMVVGMSLEDLMISIPPQMAKYGRVQVTDQTGKEVPAKITANKEQVAIAFSQPVEPGRILQVDISGVQISDEQDAILLYGVTAKRVGLRGQIPIGTARILPPVRS